MQFDERNGPRMRMMCAGIQDATGGGCSTRGRAHTLVRLMSPSGGGGYGGGADRWGAGGGSGACIFSSEASVHFSVPESSEASVHFSVSGSMNESERLVALKACGRHLQVSLSRATSEWGLHFEALGSMKVLPQFDRLLDGIIIMGCLSAAVLLLDLIKTFCFTEWLRVMWFRLTTRSTSFASSVFFFLTEVTSLNLRGC